SRVVDRPPLPRAGPVGGRPDDRGSLGAARRGAGGRRIPAAPALLSPDQGRLARGTCCSRALPASRCSTVVGVEPHIGRVGMARATGRPAPASRPINDVPTAGGA